MAVVVKKKPVVKKKAPVKTLAQLQQEQAAQIAGLAIDPAVSSINKEIAAAETQRIARLRASEGVTKAVAEMSAGDAEAARAAYAGQAERLAAYGQGLTGNLRTLQDQSAQQASDLTSRLGLSGVQSYGGQNANVAHQLNVVIPGEGIAAQAPRALLNAQAHRMALGGRLADTASMEDFKAGQTVEGIRAKIQEIEAKRPGLILEALNQIRQQANAERATNTQIGYLQLQQAKTVQDQAVAMTNMSGYLHVVVGKGKNAKVVNTGKIAAGSDAIQIQTQAETSRANTAARVAQQQQAANQRAATAAQLEKGRNARAAAANAAKVTAAKVAAQKRENKPPTVAQKATILKGANATGVSTLKTVTDRIFAGVSADPKHNKDQNTATAEYNRRLKQNRGTMMAAVINAVGANLRLIGYTSAQVKAVASRLVDAVIPTG